MEKLGPGYVLRVYHYACVIGKFTNLPNGASMCCVNFGEYEDAIVLIC